MSKRTFTDIPDPWAGRLAVASAPQWWEPPAAPRLRPHTEILDSLAPLVFDLLAAGWDEGHCTPWKRERDDCQCGAWSSIECGCGKYGTGRIVTPNPYRTEGGHHE